MIRDTSGESNADTHVVSIPAYPSGKDALQEAPHNPRGFIPAWQLATTVFPLEHPLVGEWLHPGEIALLIARQKEGKSTLALQFCLDLACGALFLDQFPTQKTRVLYVDYENKPRRLGSRLLEAANGRNLAESDCLIRAYDHLHERDLDLSSKFSGLQAAVQRYQPGLLVIDPLRLAMPTIGDSKDEKPILEVIGKCAQLQALAPGLSILIVHHLKKGQDRGELGVRLKDNPRSWIENAYGSQALIAHVDSIWGLEVSAAEGIYTFASVARSFGERIITLAKEPDSARFTYVPAELEDAFVTAEQRALWQRLPEEFGVQDMLRRDITRNLLYAVIAKGRAARLLTQDPKTKKYRKVAGGTPE
jgi:hypothetical protein